MTRLFAAYLKVILSHIFKNVSVTDFCNLALDAVLLAEFKEAHVAHNRNNGCIIGEDSPVFHILGADRNNLIAVNNLAVLVNSQHSVGITVESEAYVAAVFLNISLKSVKMSRTALTVDIDAVRH